MPDAAESYYSPVVYRRRGDVDVVLFGTGGETHGGALWALPLQGLYAADIDQVDRRSLTPSFHYLQLNNVDDISRALV